MSSLVRSAFRGATRAGYFRRLARASLDWEFACDNEQLTLVAMTSLVAFPADVRLRLTSHTWGETPSVDLLALCALVRECKPKRAFEFGTFTGNATLHIALNAPSDTQITTLDLPSEIRKGIRELEWEASIDDRVIGSVYRDSEFAARITQLFGDSRTFDTEPYRGAIDFVWVDACHEYSYVKNDSEKALDMLAPGGMVAWHDHSRGCPGVSRYLRELSRSLQVRWIDGTQVAYVVR